MSFISAVTTAIDDVTGAAASGDLTRVPAAIERLKQVLSASAEQLEGSGFGHVALTPSAFGASDAAALLGEQHRLAHAVVADTIVGVARDLVGFHHGVVEFDRAVETADTDTATDLQRRRAGVEALAQSVAHSEADALNQQSRTENLTTDGGR
jgi:hypothetical protein